MDIMQQIMQLMGMGSPATGPVVREKPPVRGYYNNQEELLPSYATGGHGPSLVDDPAFQAAKQSFIERYGHEPATDSDFAEVESMMVSGDTSRSATESEVLRTVTGTRGNQGANARGDDENLPPSDISRRALDTNTRVEPYSPTERMLDGMDPRARDADDAYADGEIDEFAQFRDERRALWEADESGSEGGFDIETLEEAEDGFGRGLWEMPAQEVMSLIMRDVSPEEAQYWDSLPPEERRRIAFEVANSDGLGSISSFMNERPQQ